MLLKKEHPKLPSPLKSPKSCENCKKLDSKIIEIEDEIKSEKEARKKLEIELEHSKVIQEQQRFLFEKRSEDFKDCSFDLKAKDQEISSLKLGIEQRDSLLAKAKKLVSSLSTELSLKIEEIEGLNSVNSDLSDEVERLKENLKDFESQKDQKNDSFSFDTESFSSKVIKTADQNQKLENDVNFMSNQLEYTQNTLKALSEENEKLKESISSLEEKCQNLTKEQTGNTQQIIFLESELTPRNPDPDAPKSVRNSLTSDDLKTFNKEMVSEITSQVLRKTHRRHRHSSNIREIYEFLEAVKGEIKNGNENFYGYSREAATIFRDFQCWYRSHKFDPRNKFLSEVLLTIISCAKGEVKEQMEELVNGFCEIDPEQVQSKIIKGIKKSFLTRSEVLGKIKGMFGNFKLGVESIELVCKRIGELKVSLKDGGLEKVVELAVAFLKGFAKERQDECEVISGLLKEIV